MANSEDPDEMPCSVASHLGLHCFLRSVCQNIQWNLGNSNANFSKLPDFSKTTDGPDFFHYNLLQKYHRFFEFQFFEKINFSNRFVGPDQRNSY